MNVFIGLLKMHAGQTWQKLRGDSGAEFSITIESGSINAHPHLSASMPVSPHPLLLNFLSTLSSQTSITALQHAHSSKNSLPLNRC